MSKKSRFTAIVVLTAVLSTLVAFSIVARPDLYQPDETDEIPAE